MIEQSDSKTRAQMWTAFVMVLLTGVGLAFASAERASWIVWIALAVNELTWVIVASACREELKSRHPSRLDIANKSDRVVRSVRHRQP